MPLNLTINPPVEENPNKPKPESSGYGGIVLQIGDHAGDFLEVPTFYLSVNALKLNMTEAESAIRDADIANKMMKHTKNTVLTQSAQAMLAQSNQNMSQVLQMIK